MKEETVKVSIRISDMDRLDEVRSLIQKERGKIRSKVDTITVLLDEFIESRKNNL